MCHSYQSVNKAKGKSENWGYNVVEIKGKKKKFTLFVCGEGGITNPLKTPAHQVQGGRGTFALKRGQKWNSPKLVLFHKCFRAQRGRISSLLPKCAGQNYVTWHALHDSTESWFACGSSTVVFVHCRGGKWSCYSYKVKFFIHFLLEVDPLQVIASKAHAFEWSMMINSLIEKAFPVAPSIIHIIEGVGSFPSDVT